MEAVRLESLSKTYPGGKRALKGVTLRLNPGEVFGFLGPNGAGKTTTVKILTGMALPSGGSCRVLGIDPAQRPEKVHALAGVVTEHAQMYDSLTGLENLRFYGAAFGLSPSECESRAKSLLRQLDLEEAENRRLAAYSTGMRQRLSLARALLHRPQVLFLDEPTSGLDPESAHNVNGMIRDLAGQEGITVFLCTHQLRYAQEICTRYGLLEEGELLAEGTLEELRAQVLSGFTLRVRASLVPPGLGLKQVGPEEYEGALSQEAEIPPVVRNIVQAGGDVYAVSAQRPTLEDIYFALTQCGKGEAV